MSRTPDFTAMDSGTVTDLAEACWILVHAGFDGAEVITIRDAAEAELSERLRLYMATRRKTAERCPCGDMVSGPTPDPPKWVQAGGMLRTG